MKANKNFVLQTIADDYIVVPVGEAAARLQGIIKLNATGAFLWNLLSEKECSEPELIEALKAEFNVEKGAAQADVSKFIRQLSGMGCLDQ